MWYSIVAVGSFVCGFTACLVLGWRVKMRLVKRLTAAEALARACWELGNRRVAYDSGRDHLVRSDGGKTARVTDGMATKPGTLTRYHEHDRDS